MPTRRHYANAAPQLTLSGAITSSATSATATPGFTGWPVTFPYFAVLELGTGNEEIVSVTNVIGSTATIVRSQDGTSGISHAAGATLDQCVIRQDFDEANAHTSANAGVHGVSGNVVGDADIQSLSNKTLSAPNINNPVFGTGFTVPGGVGISSGGSGTVSAVSLTTTGIAAVGTSATVGTTLNVTGATTLGSTLAVGGAVTTSSSLNVNGAASVGGILSCAGAFAPTSYLDDTGWVNISLASGFQTANSNVPQYRLRDGIVYFRGDVSPTSGNFATSTGVTIVAAAGLPAGVRPVSQTSTEKQLSGPSAGVSVRGFVGTDGSVQIATGATAQAYVHLAGLSGYLLN